jgi:putative transposase
VKFGFVAKHRGVWPAEWLCEALGVSRGGFYAWLTRPRSQRSRSDEEVGAKVRASFLASDRTYGARRVWHDLLAEGVRCGRHRIERLMRQQSLKARPRRRRLPPDLGERQVAAVAPNVLNRSFEAPAPNRKWIADFTGGRPGEDIAGRPDRSERRFRSFIATSFVKVLRRPLESAQYLSIKYTERLSEAGIEPSVGSVGDSYDNALAETINGLYKAEVIHRRGPWRTMEAVEFATLKWVDWFNNRRLLEPIGNIPPAEAEERYYAMMAETAVAA